MNMIIFRRFYDFSHLSAEKGYLLQNQDRISRINFEKKKTDIAKGAEEVLSPYSHLTPSLFQHDARVKTDPCEETTKREPKNQMSPEIRLLPGSRASSRSASGGTCTD